MKIVDKILKHYNDFIGFTDKDEAFKAGYQAAIDHLRRLNEDLPVYKGVQFLECEVEDEQ